MSDRTGGDGRPGRTGRFSRRGFITAGAAAVMGLAGCSGGSNTTDSGGSDGGDSDGTTPTPTVTGTPGPNAEEITMLLTPGTPSDAKRRYKPMENLIRDKVDGIDLTVRVPLNYSAIRPALESEQAEIGMDDVTLLSAPDLMDVYGTTVTGGSAFYFSMMLVPMDSSIDERTDVKGKDWAFADRLSTSGSIFALYTLQKAGLDIGEAPKGPATDFNGTWSDHEQAVKRVAEGKADGCTTYGGNGMPHVPEKLKSEFPERVINKSSALDTIDTEKPKLKPIWWSFPIPKQPVYARSSWDSAKKQEIGDVLLNSDKESIKQYYPPDYNENDLPFTTLQDTAIEDYQPIRKRMNKVGISLAP
ncbi:PhnD/SsuA/transferrin family substrate-binding protein [Halorhabdus amylolytica]|uniref:PhnD/SsuA/transferrin family substrate-binding protein n=1 Tax=Halorhabdus amylolytica TaxID=2559573 RepID=UPI0010AA3E8B|nr:PhnD/SsuA/transferrin family substrate-binding protein [Halorhabdus amylolytica]